MSDTNIARHAGPRSTIVGDMVMRVRYAFRFIFDTREYAAYADRPNERAAYADRP